MLWQGSATKSGLRILEAFDTKTLEWEASAAYPSFEGCFRLSESAVRTITKTSREMTSVYEEVVEQGGGMVAALFAEGEVSK